MPNENKDPPSPASNNENLSTSNNKTISEKETPQTPRQDSITDQSSTTDATSTTPTSATPTQNTTTINPISATPTTTTATATTTNTTPTKKASQDTSVVKVHFVAVGSAPIMKKNKIKVNADYSFSELQAFLSKMIRKSVKPDSHTPLFLYCNGAFVPSPEERLGDLRDCFNVRGELVINYSLQEAWG